MTLADARSVRKANRCRQFIPDVILRPRSVTLIASAPSLWRRGVLRQSCPDHENFYQG